MIQGILAILFSRAMLVAVSTALVTALVKGFVPIPFMAVNDTKTVHHELAVAKAEVAAMKGTLQDAINRQRASDQAIADAQTKVAEYDQALQKLHKQNRCLVTDADLVIGRLRHRQFQGDPSTRSK
jgi:hypothetical protein